jgi:NAD(P)-dependent dehydrogenase (short-subunit alcohol dehydrogenase family)
MYREGASVLMTDINDEALQKAFSKVKTAAPAGRGRLETCTVNVSTESDVQRAVDLLDGSGGVDIMFNNAGIMHPKDGDSFEVDDGTWDLTMNINVKGVWYGSKHAVRSMRKHGKTKGSIINTASVVALVGSAAAQLAYTASKGAVLAMTRELAMVHAREGE